MYKIDRRRGAGFQKSYTRSLDGPQRPIFAILQVYAKSYSKGISILHAIIDLRRKTISQKILSKI